MNFEELGLTFKQEREKKGLSIEAVMEATKISRSNLVALENGDRSAIPHPVYAKGFVKSYARYLGLDADELSMVIDREFQDENSLPEELAYDVSPAAEKAFHDGEIMEVGKKSSWPLILVLVFLLAIGVFVALNFMDKEADQQFDEEVPAVSTQTPTKPAPIVPEKEAADEGAATGEQGASDEGPEAGDAKSEDGADVSATDQETAVEESVQDEAEAQPQVSAQPEPESQPATADETESEEPRYDHVLIIRATTEKGCWVGVWKGDDPDMSSDFVLSKGEPLRLMFNSPRRIRIGNVAGVTVTYNGEPYTLDNARGNIQTLRLGFD